MKRYLIRRWRNLRVSKASLLLLLISLTFYNITSINAQNRITVKYIKGSCTVQNLSPEKAKEEAILDAKKNALRQAGIIEDIKSLDALNTFSDNDKVNQFFNSFSTIELNGAIVDWSIVKEEKIIDEFNNFVYNVYIDAKILKYSTTIDKEFIVSIDGIKDAYREKEAISFTLKPTKSCYIKFFLIESPDSVFLIYPNEYEPAVAFEANRNFRFPMNDHINYTASLNKSSESNLVLIIATKKNIPFASEVNYNNVMNWLNGIELDQKYVIVKLINLYNN